MHTITTSNGLKLAISMLEEKNKEQGEIIGEQVSGALEALKPVNVLRDTFRNFLIPGMRNNLVNLALGTGVGFLVRKWRLNKAQSRIKHVLSDVISFGVNEFMRVKSKQIFSRNGDG